MLAILYGCKGWQQGREMLTKTKPFLAIAANALKDERQCGHCSMDM
jgi:hypothetical protein